MEGHVGTESTHLRVTVWKDLQMEKEEFVRSVRIPHRIYPIWIRPFTEGVKLVQNFTTASLLCRHIQVLEKNFWTDVDLNNFRYWWLWNRAMSERWFMYWWRQFLYLQLFWRIQQWRTWHLWNWLVNTCLEAIFTTVDISYID